MEGHRGQVGELAASPPHTQVSPWTLGQEQQKEGLPVTH